MSSVDNLKGRIKIGSRKKAMRRDKFKRSMSESNLKTIMEESGQSEYFYTDNRIFLFTKNILASEDESGYTSRSNSLTPPSSPPLRFGSSDQFSKFACGAGAGMCLNKSRGLGISQTDRGDHWTDKVGVRFHTYWLGLLFTFIKTRAIFDNTESQQIVNTNYTRRTEGQIRVK